MEAALYDSESGYYSRGAAIGEAGDFVTSPSISPIFAQTIARLFASDAENFEGEIAFCEAGSGAGSFLRDFRKALAEIAPVVSRRTAIRAIERSVAGRAAIAGEMLADRVAADASEWSNDRFEGWIFSNEIYDALPVHRVIQRDEGLFELGVTLSRRERASEGDLGELSWTTWPAPPVLTNYLARFSVSLEEGQVAEINLDAAPLHRSLARLLSRGRMLSFDYGHRAAVLYHPHARRSGTLAIHFGGRRGGDPLANPGEVDLTAHVNWDDLVEAGSAEGFETDGRMRQSEFLLAAGLFENVADRKLEAMRLFDPEGIGEMLSVLLQSKGIARLRFFSQLTSPG